jgi:signal transduction histidine kinase
MPLRPLDPIGSIKTKLGILIAVTVSLAALTPIAADAVGLDARVAIPAAIVIALAATQLLARGTTSPLREMTAAARQMARGRYDVRVTATSRDEVGDLARAFNTMAADLDAVDRQRRELVANVSHELRTPVSALQAVLENLVDGIATPTPETLRAALEQTGRLSRLVSDLLDLSRVDAGITALDREEIDLATFLGEAVEEARLSGHEVSYDVVADPGLVVRADRARLHQLMANLLDNAGRHSPARGTVTARAAATETGVAIDVSDEGPGIPPADRARVFERFTTGGTSDGGTGLGLAIARWVTTLHGGSIEVADVSAGCRIRAHFPDREETR